MFKFKTIQLFTGVLSIFIISTPVVLRAQQLPNLPSPNVPVEWFPALAEVELSLQQKSQLEDIRKNTRSQVESILTLPQQNQFQTALLEGNSFFAAVKAMNLSPKQQRQLRKVMESTRSQVVSTLTLQQRQQILQNLRTQWQGQGGRFLPLAH
ncbi:MAG: hypothetical protein SAK29_35435 [Scytonema sp. PMC 1069.18]|nr:hypothetical protein [Scytonema sp. PMC 1069.18]MEC4882117.1 hypothetical protein [Scytonema sp. PMC 1070.18]